MTWHDLNAEAQAHIDERAAELIDQGIPEAAARAQARREFGNATRNIESSREVWIARWAEDLAQDLRYAFRSLRASPLFTFLAVASLALGIGANTAIFSFMDAILWRNLPIADPESLVVLKFQRPLKTRGEVRGSGFDGRMAMHITSGGSRNGTFSVFPYPAFEIFDKRTDLFTSAFSYHGQTEARLSVDGAATLGDTVYVSGSYFTSLGVPLSAGRLLTPEDDQPGAPPAAILSASFAQQSFGGIAAALNQTVAVNGVNFTIAGVASPGFFGVNPEWTPEVYLPLHSYLLTQPPRFTENGKLFAQPSAYWLDVMARLRPGVTVRQAQAALDPVFREYFQTASGPTDRQARLSVLPGAAGLDSLRYLYSKPLLVLLVTVGLILAIACANIAGLLLARASARRREMAVRLSVGASRARVIRQLLTEGILLSLISAASGLLLARWSIGVLTALLSAGRPDFTLRAALNPTVLAATLALAVTVGIAFSLAPAWQSTKVDLLPALREIASAPAPRRRWLRFHVGQSLITLQIALCFLLLFGSGLFLRTLTKLQALELGFNADNLLLLEVNAQQGGYQDAPALALHETIRSRFATIPGVQSATLAAEGQLDGGNWSLDFAVPDSISARNSGAPLLPVGPNYLTTMQIPILRGRDITLADQYRKPAPVVISEAFARKHYGTADPIGRRITMDFMDKTELEVVGVAANARYGNLKEDPPAMLYVDYRHSKGFLVGVIRVTLRTAAPTAGVVNAARQMLRQIDPGLPLGMVSSQRAQIDSTINQEILFARLCSAFALLALIIACVGLYGITAYNVSRRTAEIGIRRALGAQRHTILTMVLREAAILGIAGLVIGVPIALAASKFLASFLYGLEPTDPATVAVTVVILLSAALLAAFIPSQRAARINPMAALRHE